MFCPNCGNAMQSDALRCTSCHWQEPVHPQSNETDAAMRILLPVGRSVYAIIAGYLGLVSPLVIPAPFAFIFGIIALRDIKRHPDRSGKGRAIFGIVMGLIFSLLLLLVIVSAIGAASSGK